MKSLFWKERRDITGVSNQKKQESESFRIAHK